MNLLAHVACDAALRATCRSEGGRALAAVEEVEEEQEVGCCRVKRRLRCFRCKTWRTSSLWELGTGAATEAAAYHMRAARVWGVRRLARQAFSRSHHRILPTKPSLRRTGRWATDQDARRRLGPTKASWPPMVPTAARRRRWARRLRSAWRLRWRHVTRRGGRRRRRRMAAQRARRTRRRKGVRGTVVGAWALERASLRVARARAARCARGQASWEVTIPGRRKRARERRWRRRG